MSAIERGVQGGEIKNLATPSIDDYSPLRKGRQLTPPNHAAGFRGQLRHQYEDVALSEHCVKIRLHFDAGQACKPWVDVRVIAENAAIKSVFQLARDLGADKSDADDADSPSFQLSDLQARAQIPGRSIPNASITPNQLFGRGQDHHDRMLRDRHAAETLVIYDQDAALGRVRNIDIVGAESGGRHDDEVFTGIKHVRRNTLRSANPKCLRAMQDLL